MTFHIMRLVNIRFDQRQAGDARIPADHIEDGHASTTRAHSNASGPKDSESVAAGAEEPGHLTSETKLSSDGAADTTSRECDCAGVN